MMTTHRHHACPLSLHFPNWTENIVEIDFIQHRIVHAILNIPFENLRTFRKRTNHLLYHNKYYVEELQRLHLAYFARFEMLPDDLQVVHLNAIINVFNRSQVFYECLIMYEIPKGNTKEQFYAYLSHYHAVLFAKAEILEQKMNVF